MMRLFVAIDFPGEVKQQLARLVDLLVEEGYPLTFEKEENFHLTLKFLGWVDNNSKKQIVNSKNIKQNSKLEKIYEAIKWATIGIKPFWFEPTSIGYFLKESLILWVGVEAQEELFKLVEQLENEFAKIGFPKEKREFSPHITLGRRRHTAPLAKWRRVGEEIKEKFASPNEKKFTKFVVSKVVLMQSTLTQEGSIYCPVNVFPLITSSLD